MYGVGKMAQRFKAIAALANNLDLGATTDVAHNHLCNSSSKGSDALRHSLYKCGTHKYSDKTLTHKLNLCREKIYFLPRFLLQSGSLLSKALTPFLYFLPREPRMEGTCKEKRGTRLLKAWREKAHLPKNLFVSWVGPHTSQICVQSQDYPCSNIETVCVCVPQWSIQARCRCSSVRFFMFAAETLLKLLFQLTFEFSSLGSPLPRRLLPIPTTVPWVSWNLILVFETSCTVLFRLVPCTIFLWLVPEFLGSNS